MTRPTIASISAAHAAELLALQEAHATKIAALNDRIAALEARLVVAATVYKNQRAKIGELEAALNTRGVKTAPAQRPVYQPAPPTAEQLAWRAYSAEQSALAMVSGKSVKMLSRTEFGAWYAEQAVMPETA